MMKTLRILLITLFSGNLVAMPATAPNEALNEPLNKVLNAYVTKGQVNYKALKAKPAELDTYLKQAAAVSRADFSTWSKDAQMAFYINLYNAATLKHITNHYPVSSIKKIGGWFTSPWKIEFISLFGSKVHLDHIEHEILRKQYSDARIHFALVCAAKSCPPLRSEAYNGSQLSAQLDDQGRIFMADSGKNSVSVSNRRITVSKIFDWFEEDFVKHSGSVQKFVAPYFPQTSLPATGIDNFSVRHSDYDWSLNEK